MIQKKLLTEKLKCNKCNFRNYIYIYMINLLNITSWNDTVANLTLMALGSSSPEILLSVIEICGNNFLAGDLGPGTIVGK